MAEITHFQTKDKEISIVGTGHVLKKSVALVKSEIKDFKPEVVALELDMNRFLAMNKRKKAKPKGIMEYLFRELQIKASKTTGVKPGAEMMAAAKEARKHNIPVVLIDRDVRITFRRGLRNITLHEKAKLLWGIIAGFFEVGDKAKLDALIDQKEELMEEFNKELPSIYKAFVTERDYYMARAIHFLPQSRVMVVVGAGHTKGIRKHLEYRK